MDIKYEGKLDDGTSYTLELKCEDEEVYRTLVNALKNTKGNFVVEGGILTIVGDLTDLVNSPDIFKDMMKANIECATKKIRIRTPKPINDYKN